MTDYTFPYMLSLFSHSPVIMVSSQKCAIIVFSNTLAIFLIQYADKTFVFSSGLLYCLAILALSVAFSSLTYYTIEVPCRKWINKKWAHRKYIVYDTDERLSKAS